MSLAFERHLTPELLNLMEHEKGIEQGLTDALWHYEQIRDRRLFVAAGYSTFEDYCDRRLAMTAQRVNQLIKSVETIKAIAPILERRSETIVSEPIPLPTNEAQTRPLAALPTPEAKAEAWAEAVERADGEQPTAREVAEVVAERRTPKPVPKPMPKPVAPVADESTIRPHPATYPAAVIAVFRELLRDHEVGDVLDPFGGVGGIHQLAPEFDTYAVELEPEWAQIHPSTIVGDSRRLDDIFPGRQFDAIATSPAYGNRLADAFYNAADPEARRSYAIDLGRPLTAGNGAGMHFGDGDYETLHEAVWAAAVAALKPGGLFLLNCKDFQRGGEVVPVTGWHIDCLAALGLVARDLRTLPIAGLPNTTAARLSELIVVFEKGQR